MPTPGSNLRNSWNWVHPTLKPLLVERAPNQPYLVAPGKLAVQKLPDFKMTSSKILK
jgi:hypothetical protein